MAPLATRARGVMKVFVARQPIFDQRQRVLAYELLFRQDEREAAVVPDGDLATRSVMSHALHVFGFDELTRTRRAFINFTRQLLVQQTAMLLPPNRVVIEVLETVEPDEEVVWACRALKRGGYMLALDDFVHRPGYERLIELADIVKVDFIATPHDVRQELARRLRPRGIKLLAEKVETGADFREGIALGYELFQGYFFCRPEIVSREDVPGYKLNCLRLLREIAQPEIDFDRIEFLMKQDIALSVKLLRYINSAWFGLSRQVSSLRHAMTLLGSRGLRQWASLVILSGIARDRPVELLSVSLLRAMFCERLAPHLALEPRGAELFLLGLLSVLDALIGRPMDEVLREVAVSEDICLALLEQTGPLAAPYRLVLAYEQGSWDTVSDLTATLALDPGIVADVYEQSVQWVDQVLMT